MNKIGIRFVFIEGECIGHVTNPDVDWRCMGNVQGLSKMVICERFWLNRM